MKSSLYILVHRHTLTAGEVSVFDEGEPIFSDDRDETFKIIGIFSSEEKAGKAAEHARNMPGFKTAPDGFAVHEYQLNDDHWATGFSTPETTH